MKIASRWGLFFLGGDLLLETAFFVAARPYGNEVAGVVAVGFGEWIATFFLLGFEGGLEFLFFGEVFGVVAIDLATGLL